MFQPTPYEGVEPTDDSENPMKYPLIFKELDEHSDIQNEAHNTQDDKKYRKDQF
jgi:hypothetical protein